MKRNEEMRHVCRPRIWYYACMKHEPKRVVVIAGPSGSGESTFTEELMLAYPNFTRTVSATTRAPRGNEKDGVDYYFMTKEKFFEEVQNGNIPEHVLVRARDAYYGTYLPDLTRRLASGKTVVANTDLSGAEYYKKNYNAVTVFIKPKSIFSLYNRLVHRDPTMPKEEVLTRVMSAVQEILEAESNYDHVVFTGDNEFAETLIHIVDKLKHEGYVV